MPSPDPDVLKRRAKIVKDLRRAVPGAVVIEDEAGREAFETDAFAAYRRLPLLVLLPGSTEEVSAILRYCHQHSLNVVARGAGTSLSGGAVPTEDAVVVSLSRMRRVLDIDYDNRAARVEAGVTNLAITEAMREQQFFYAPDPASQLACTIGGNIAVNAGGARALKYGVTTNNVLGVRLVMMDGEIVDLGGDHLDAGGFDLIGLVNGSEGQLGIVTEAVVRIQRRPEQARPMLIGFNSARDAGNCVAGIIASGLVPAAIEFMDKRAIHISESHSKAGYPLDAEAVLIIECEGSENEIRLQFDEIRDIARPFSPWTVREAQSDEESERLWKGRKAVFGAMGQLSDFMCLDGVIPISRIADVLGWVEHICRHHGFEVANVFRAGDGNLHPIIFYNANDEEELRRAEICGAELMRLCIKAGGCLTGEHGVGIEKRELMRDQFGDYDLLQQTRVKSVFDPEWLLNPAKVFPLDAPGRGGVEATLAELAADSARGA
jgi:glycolate oxidase